MILKDTLGCDFAYNFTNAWSVTLTEGGIFGAMTIEQTAEIGSSPLTLARGRFPLAQPTIAMGNFRQVCIFRTPRNSGIRGEVYLKPFASIVWIFLVAIITMTAILLWITFKVESSKLKIYLRFIPSLLTSGLIAFGSACCQGSFLVPRSMGGRVAFFSLSLLTFIIYNYYTSIVVAILLGSPVKSNIKTLLQLGESNLGMAIEPIPYTKMYINTSNDPAIRSIVRNKIQPLKDPQSIWMPIKEGLHRIHDDPGFVYVTDTFASYDLIERSFTAQEICDTNEILFRPEQLLYEQMHRNSSYREFVKIKQLRILESGVHRRHEGKWIKKRLHCYLSSGVLLQVGLEYTAPLFIMMASVYGLVIILLLMEICWFKYWKGVNVARFMTFGKN
uniref:Ionotropic glutamate receptor C-terminal domain-containing protein n=1 Tax=Stomoxys calcitrans TaxID=35570 RepID=A0A1I8P017_STOCA